MLVEPLPPPEESPTAMMEEVMPEAPKPPAAPLEDVPREDEVTDEPPLTPPVTTCTALLLEPPTEDDDGQTQKQTNIIKSIYGRTVTGVTDVEQVFKELKYYTTCLVRDVMLQRLKSHEYTEQLITYSIMKAYCSFV